MNQAKGRKMCDNVIKKSNIASILKSDKLTLDNRKPPNKFQRGRRINPNGHQFMQIPEAQGLNSSLAVRTLPSMEPVLAVVTKEIRYRGREIWV